MLFFALLFFLSNILIGCIITNYYLSFLPKFTKLLSSFFIGTYFTAIITFIIALLLKKTQEPLLESIYLVFIFNAFFITYVFKNRRSLIKLQLSKVETTLSIILLCFSYYIMQKSFGYENNSFQIASNLYIDFGAHIPIIRSFSVDDNIPPTYPFYANIPLIYHFFYDFLIACYEKLGMRIDIAFNAISAFSLAGLLGLVFSFSQELFNKKKLIGILAIILFIFNSSLSFIYAVKAYWGSQIISKLYHHNIYLGDGPFGNNIVSIFWNLNTYLNQRHFIFALGMFLIIVHTFYLTLTKKKIVIPWLFLAVVVGLLPFWHPAIFFATICMAFIIFVILWTKKKNWKQILFFIIASVVIAFPQIYFMKQVQNISYSFLNIGFLIANKLSLTNIIQYWIYNLGLSIIMIPLSVWVAKGKRSFFIVISILFFLPNIFQFSPQMFDNHKFFNMFIIFANIYIAYLLYLLLQKKIIVKIFALVLLFFLTFSGVIDFFVIKNDIKTPIKDYPANEMLQWVKENTDSQTIFLTNAEIYDPITLIGRESFIGRPHYLWAYGINPEERLKIKNELFSEATPQTIQIIRQQIDYIIVYKDHIKNNESIKQFSFCIKIYEDKDGTICKVKKASYALLK